MNRALVAPGLALAILSALGAAADDDSAVQRDILAIEREGMDGWLRGDPDPQLRTLDPEITYIHAVTNGRLEGLAAVRVLTETYRGRPLYDSYEIVAPKVQGGGDVRVLSYECVTHNGTLTRHWNATQIYRRQQGAWRVIHTHWSALQSAPTTQP